mmetsp:Transcript_47406/g.57404  ORF Transcript_47406/g.57404 Transcript_47406/m.57404 type:complete len:215 (-) Transcript_47406:248-892(-)
MTSAQLTALIFLGASATLSSGFSGHGKQRCFIRNRESSLSMGIFEKQDISNPGEGRPRVDADRETPIDRWFGWNTKEGETDTLQAPGSKAPLNFVDSMDPANYVSVSLQKPMGITFEENDDETKGVFVVSLAEGSNSAQNGVLKRGDQLVAVNEVKTTGMTLDDALDSIISAETDSTKLLLFRGSTKQLYGPTGASREWLDEFIGNGGVEATSA